MWNMYPFGMPPQKDPPKPEPPPEPRADVTFYMDDQIADQSPWEDAHCPQRGPGLTHHIAHLPVGPCSYCEVVVILKIDLERVMSLPVPAVYHDYRETARLHSRDAFIADASQRPITAARHRNAASRLQRVALDEEFDPEPLDR